MVIDYPEKLNEQQRKALELLDEDYLILSTIHSAKEQKWRSVFTLNVIDGCIPSDFGTGTTQELEEERHLFYVGMTRAKDNLSLITPQRFFSTVRTHRVIGTFIHSVPSSPRTRCNNTSNRWLGLKSCSQHLSEVPNRSRINVGARTRGMWK